MPGSPISAPRDIRFRWYLQVEKHGKTIKETCAIFGVSKKTYHKWYRRDHGYGPNDYHPKREHPQTKLSGVVAEAVEEEKKKYNYGPKKTMIFVRREFGLGVSTTAIYNFFKKKKLIRKPQRKQAWYAPMKRPCRAKKPGQNVQLDLKYVPGEENRWEYQYRFIDALTSVQFVVQTLDRSAEASIGAFREARRYFPFVIRGIQTDNGGEFRGAFALFLRSIGVRQRFIPKRSAPWNGKVERANRSVDDEYYLNPGRPWKNIDEYVAWYNKKRPHLGRGMRGMTPLERYEQYLFRGRKQSPLKVN